MTLVTTTTRQNDYPSPIIIKKKATNIYFRGFSKLFAEGSEFKKPFSSNRIRTHLATVPSTTNLTIVIISLRTVMKIGKYLPLIVGGMATLSLLLAANDFIAGNLAFGIINSIFALGGFIFLIQLFQHEINTHTDPFIRLGRRRAKN